MASNTERLKLLKKDPLTDGNETFNIQTMLNDNWDKLDEAVGSLQDEIANLDPDIPEGSITQKGIVQLSSATNSTSETLAATPKAVKAAYDLANGKIGVTKITSGSFDPNTLGGGMKIIEIKSNGSTTFSNMPDQAGGLLVQGEGSHARWLQQMYLSQEGPVYFRSGYDNSGTLTWRAWEKIVTNEQTSAWQKYKLTDINGRALNISGQDLNNITTGGFYNGSNLVNAPDTTSWWYIEVIAHTNNNGYTLQKAYMLNGNVRNMYMRTQEGGTWSTWSQVITSNGGTINGPLSIVANGANGLDLVGTDHVYMELFPKGTAAGRKGYIGYPSPNDNNLAIVNDNGVVQLYGSAGITLSSETDVPKLWVAKNTSFGSGTGLSLAIGDSDTGFNWVGDGYIDIYSNNVVVAVLKSGDFLLRDVNGNYISLKQELANLKNRHIISSAAPSGGNDGDIWFQYQ